MEKLRKLIRLIIEQEDEEKANLLTEPDEADEEETETEVSSGGVAGVSVPLGGGPNYPSRTRRKPNMRTPYESAASAFGGSKTKKN